MKKLLILLLFPSLLWATNYYVKTTGNDGNAGLGTADGEAWLTITHAFTQLTSGDTALVMAGTYTEDTLCPASDTVTLKAYPGAVVWVAGVQSAGEGRAPVFWIDGVDGFIMDSINVKYGRGVTILFGLNTATVGSKILNCKVCSVYAGWGSQTADMIELMQNSGSSEVRNCTLFVTGMNGSLPTSHNNCAIIMYGGSAGQSNNNRITNNCIHDVVTGIWKKHGNNEGSDRFDSNTVYSWHWAAIVTNEDSTMIHHNLLYAGDSVSNIGIRVLEDAGGFNDARFSQIYNNTVYGCSQIGIHHYYKQAFLASGYSLDSSQVWNNIVSEIGQTNSHMMIHSDASGTDPPDSLYSDFNCFYDASSQEIIRYAYSNYYTLAEWQTATNKDANSITSDPLFVNAAGGDFTITTASPCATMGRGGSYASYMGYWNPGIVKKVLGKGTFRKMNLQ